MTIQRMLLAFLMAIGFSLAPTSPVAAAQSVGTSGCQVTWTSPTIYGHQQANVACYQWFQYRARVQCRYATTATHTYGFGPWVGAGRWSSVNCRSVALSQGRGSPEKWVVNWVDVQIP